MTNVGTLGDQIGRVAQNRYRIRPHGALALVLYVSRALCAAPLVFEKRGTRISRLLFIAGRIFITISCVYVIFDTYYQLIYVSADMTIFSRIFWALVEGGILMTNMIAVYTAERRMHIYLQTLHCLNEMNKTINDIKIRKTRKLIDIIIKYYIVVCMIITIIPYAVYLVHVFSAFNGLFAFRFIIQLAVHCSERILISVLTMQFAMLALQVLYVLKNVNAQFSQEIENGVLEVSRIRQYAFEHISASNIVRQVVQNDENIIIVILITFFASLGWIIQTFFSEMYKHRIERFDVDIIYLTITGVTYLIYLIILTEPCHRVHEEMETTHRFVCKSLQFPNLSLHVTNELEAFKLLLELNKPTYSPLRLCTLARPLFLKIVGTLISYGVFVLQLSEEFF